MEKNGLNDDYLKNKKVQGYYNLEDEWINVSKYYKLEKILKQDELVYGICKTTGQNVAIKIKEDFCQSKYESIKLLREIQILRRLSKAQNEDSFAPRLIDIIVIKDQNKYADNYTLFLVSEYFGTSLKDLIDLGSESKLNYNHLLTIFFNSLMALRNIHSANIIHRDIQPSNILVNQKCQVKINDFNMARTLPKKQYEFQLQKDKIEENSADEQTQNSNKLFSFLILRLQQQQRDNLNYNQQNCIQQQKKNKDVFHYAVGSRWYRAPEICLQNDHYDQQSDVWSLACSIHELIMAFQQIQSQNQDNKKKTKFTSQQNLDRILFPGDSCFGSLKKNPCLFQESLNMIQNDQLSLIISKLNGSLNDEDLLFIMNGDQKQFAIQLLQLQNKYDPTRFQNITNQYNFSDELLNVDKEIPNLLNSMLQFNPFFRKSASECLLSPLFKNFKKDEKGSQQQIFLECDEHDEENSKSNMSLQDYIKIIVHEAQEIHSERLLLLSNRKKT